jgi:hypothetical protein
MKTHIGFEVVMMVVLNPPNFNINLRLLAPEYQNLTVMTAKSSASNPPPYGADTSLYIFLENSEGKLLPEHPFYQFVEETRQGFLSSGDTLEYMANSTFSDNPTSQSQLARVDEIRGLLRYDFPVIVGSKSAAIGGGLPPGSPNIAEKVAGREHIYLEQDMIDQCKKGSDGRRL